MQNLGQNLPSYEGELTAQLTPEEQLAREYINSYKPSQAMDSMMSSAITSALSGKPSMDVSSNAIEKLYRSGVASPMLRSFDQDIAPRIDEAFAQGGALSSTRRGDTTQKGLRDLTAQLAAGLSQAQLGGMNLQAQLAESAANRQQQAVPLAEAFGMRGLSRGSALQTAAQPYAAKEQQGLTNAYNEWLRTQAATSPYMGYALNFTGQPQVGMYQPAPSQGADYSGLGSLGGIALASLLGGFGGGGGGGAAASAMPSMAPGLGGMFNFPGLLF